MRVELVYAPGCDNYKKARNTLEGVIAEERLPVSVELVEEVGQRSGSPTVRIDGKEIKHKPIPLQFEQLCELFSRRWNEFTGGARKSKTL